MSEQGEQPEILPGDLITVPGVYMSRSNCPVAVRGYDSGCWKADWEDGVRWYHSSGVQAGLKVPNDPYQLVRWVGPLAEDIPTTSQQIAEIEGQVEQTEPQAVQVCEGRWRTRNGEVRHVTPTPESRNVFNQNRYSWYDAQYNQTWLPSGHYTLGGESQWDLLDYLGPIQPKPEPEPEPEPEQQPEPQQAPQAESNAEQRVKLLKHANNTQAETIGRLNGEIRDLRTELAEATQERYAQTARIGHLETINSTHAETISGLHSEIHGLNMEIGGLQRERSQKDDRIGYLETMNSGQAAAVRAAGEQNTQLRTLADNARRQLEAAADEISELRKSLDDAEKQLDQKDAQIRDLRIELDAAQQIPKPLTDEQQELIWDQATQEAGEQLIRWLHPLVHALKQQPNERFLSFMAITLSVLPEIVPQLLGYEEDGRGESAEE